MLPIKQQTTKIQFIHVLKISRSLSGTSKENVCMLRFQFARRVRLAFKDHHF